MVSALFRAVVGIALLALVAWPAREHPVIVWSGDGADSYALCVSCGWGETLVSQPGFDMEFDGHVDDGPHVLPEILFGSESAWDRAARGAQY